MGGRGGYLVGGWVGGVEFVFNFLLFVDWLVVVELVVFFLGGVWLGGNFILICCVEVWFLV